MIEITIWHYLILIMFIALLLITVQLIDRLFKEIKLSNQIFQVNNILLVFKNEGVSVTRINLIKYLNNIDRLTKKFNFLLLLDSILIMVAMLWAVYIDLLPSYLFNVAIVYWLIVAGIGILLITLVFYGNRQVRNYYLNSSEARN